jgi:hypothetical protein
LYPGLFASRLLAAWSALVDVDIVAQAQRFARHNVVG